LFGKTPLKAQNGPLPPLATPMLLSLIGEYLIYRDTWVMQYHGKATS